MADDGAPNLTTIHSSLTWMYLGDGYWLMVVSTPERAILELLDELPDRETFHQADVLQEGPVNLSPKRMSRLLGECRSVKVKRLFLWFADRHSHARFERLDCNGLDLGSGKRMVFKGGKLDSKYWITVLKTFDDGR